MLPNKENLNDMELTMERQKYLEIHGIEKGFPMYVLFYDNNMKGFFTLANAEKFAETNKLSDYKIEIVRVIDATYISYECE